MYSDPPLTLARHVYCCTIYPGTSCVLVHHGPLARYLKLWVVQKPGMLGTFSLPPWVINPDMHHGTCIMHMLGFIPGSIISVFLWSPSIPGACIFLRGPFIQTYHVYSSINHPDPPMYTRPPFILANDFYRYATHCTHCVYCFPTHPDPPCIIVHQSFWPTMYTGAQLILAHHI